MKVGMEALHGPQSMDSLSPRLIGYCAAGSHKAELLEQTGKAVGTRPQGSFQSWAGWGFTLTGADAYPGHGVLSAHKTFVIRPSTGSWSVYNMGSYTTNISLDQRLTLWQRGCG